MSTIMSGEGRSFMSRHFLRGSSVRVLFGIVLLLLGLVQVSSFAQAEMRIQKVHAPRAGITAWLVEDHTVPLIAMRFAFKGGAAFEPAEKQGLSTFLAAMLDEGAGGLKSAEFQRRMEDLAMRMSFSAGMEFFTGSFTTLTRNRDAAFKLLALAVQKPRFDAEALERIRKQLIVSLRNQSEKPDHQAFMAFKKALFGDHPYARDTDGTEAGVKAITADDLRAWHKRVFTRDHLIVTVAGDIDAKTLARLLDETFAPLPAKSDLGAVPDPRVPEEGFVKVIRRPIPQTLIYVGHKGLLRSDPDFIPAYVVNHILGNGALSRLNKAVRQQRGLAYVVYSALFAWKKAGVFFAYAGTRNAKAAEALSIIRAEIARMAKEGPTEKELEDAKLYLTGSFPLRFDSTSKIADILMAFRKQDLGIDYVNRRNDLIRAVTIEDARRVAKRLLRPDRLKAILLGNPENVPNSADRKVGKNKASTQPARTTPPAPAAAAKGNVTPAR